MKANCLREGCFYILKGAKYSNSHQTKKIKVIEITEKTIFYINSDIYFNNNNNFTHPFSTNRQLMIDFDDEWIVIEFVGEDNCVGGMCPHQREFFGDIP